MRTRTLPLSRKLKRAFTNGYNNEKHHNPNESLRLSLPILYHFLFGIHVLIRAWTDFIFVFIILKVQIWWYLNSIVILVFVIVKGSHELFGSFSFGSDWLSLIIWQQIICGSDFKACIRWGDWVPSELFNVVFHLLFLLLPFNHLKLTLESVISFNPLEKVSLHQYIKQMERELVIEVVLNRMSFYRVIVESNPVEVGANPRH